MKKIIFIGLLLVIVMLLFLKNKTSDIKNISLKYNDIRREHKIKAIPEHIDASDIYYNNQLDVYVCNWELFRDTLKSFYITKHTFLKKSILGSYEVVMEEDIFQVKNVKDIKKYSISRMYYLNNDTYDTLSAINKVDISFSEVNITKRLTLGEKYMICPYSEDWCIVSNSVADSLIAILSSGNL